MEVLTGYFKKFPMEMGSGQTGKGTYAAMRVIGSVHLSTMGEGVKSLLF